MIYMFGPRSSVSMEKRIEQSSIPFKQKSEPINIPPSLQRQMDIPFKSSVNSQNLQGTNLVQENYQWRIQQPVVDMEDTTIALQIDFSPIPNQKKRFIDFQDFSTFLLNYAGTDFPTGISLACDEMGGYLNAEKVQTHIVANTTPFNVTSVVNPGGIIGYNILYKNSGGVIWDITNLNILTFRVKLFGDLTYRKLPSAQPLQITAKVTRVIF